MIPPRPRARFRARFRALALAAALPFLAACENSATPMLIDGKDHALILVREQNMFWKDEVTQYLIASRLPHCQRRVKIHPGRKAAVPIEVYEAGDLLFALRQGEQWYLASTETCQVQDWQKPAGQSPGPALGRFEVAGGVMVFTPAAEAR
ncbi:MAG: hypothetical protein LBI92_12170 [Azoarcus sp.]|jgi:hypothetical protein|nr:hypothetical protein [Azoarcus sp.]